MWAWFWQRQSATTDPLTHIIDCMEHIGIATKQIEEVKVSLIGFHCWEENWVTADGGCGCGRTRLRKARKFENDKKNRKGVHQGRNFIVSSQQKRILWEKRWYRTALLSIRQELWIVLLLWWWSSDWISGTSSCGFGRRRLKRGFRERIWWWRSAFWRQWLHGRHQTSGNGLQLSATSGLSFPMACAYSCNSCLNRSSQEVDTDDSDEDGDEFNAKTEEQRKGQDATLTHLQKIKAQRKISSTPLHDYLNPKRVLHPNVIRGIIPEDSELDDTDSDRVAFQTPNVTATGSGLHRPDATAGDSALFTAAAASPSDFDSDSPAELRFSQTENFGSDELTDITDGPDDDAESSFGRQNAASVRFSVPIKCNDNNNNDNLRPTTAIPSGSKSSTTPIRLQGEPQNSNPQKERRNASVAQPFLRSTNHKPVITTKETPRNVSGSFEDSHVIRIRTRARVDSSTDDDDSSTPEAHRRAQPHDGESHA